MWAYNDALADVVKGLVSAPFIVFVIITIITITIIIIAGRN